ncbi:hypothetical protein ACEPU1_32150 [Pseudomonas aeruginosa]
MKLYHGTSKEFLESIEEDGLDAPSYWGTRDQAEEYAASYGENGVILVADIDPDDLKASVYVAQAMYDDSQIDVMPDEDDLAYSLENLGGVTCHATVHHFDIEELAPAKSFSPGMGM